MTTEAKVGAFVLGCFSVLAFTLIYLINAQFGGHTVPYRTYLRYAGGLEPGASVLFGGIDVGKVTAVRPAASDPTKIEILLDVKENTPLNEKSMAKLGLVSVMSGAALSITTGSNDAKRLPPGSVIPSQEAASLDEIAGKMAVRRRQRERLDHRGARRTARNQRRCAYAARKPEYCDGPTQSAEDPSPA